jgi:hypothetical protein
MMIRTEKEMPSAERGQMLAIVAAAMVVILAMVGLVIDVGHAWGQERDSQNGADASAHAGAIVLLERLTGGPTPTGGWDWAVHLAVQQSATENGITVPEAEYVYWDAAEGNWARYSPSIMVGPADGLADPPANAQGVAAVGQKVFQPFIAQVLGFTSFTANTTATAVAGNIGGPCELEDCALLPIAFPATVVTCSGSNQSQITTDDWPINTEVIMPLCGNNPGSVGWVDWTPNETTPGCTGTGTAEIICHVKNPPHQFITMPSWQKITATGSPSSLALENALNAYAGQIILLPLFDSTCRQEPSNPELDGCPPEHVGGAGMNQWYHVPDPGLAAFRLAYPKGAYTNGNNSSVCNTGNGATQCLLGTFVNYVGSGTVEGWDPDLECDAVGRCSFGVQLVE